MRVIVHTSSNNQNGCRSRVGNFNDRINNSRRDRPHCKDDNTLNHGKSSHCEDRSTITGSIVMNRERDMGDKNRVRNQAASPWKVRHGINISLDLA